VFLWELRQDAGRKDDSADRQNHPLVHPRDAAKTDDLVVLDRHLAAGASVGQDAGRSDDPAVGVRDCRSARDRDFH
jgi:hypothetical protein